MRDHDCSGEAATDGRKSIQIIFNTEFTEGTERSRGAHRRVPLAARPPVPGATQLPVAWLRRPLCE